MCQQNRKDNTQINYFPEVYGWACGANPFMTRYEANNNFFDIKDKIVKEYITDYNAKNPGKEITEEEVDSDLVLDNKLNEQTATELSHAQINMNDSAMIELNNTIEKLFISREEGKQYNMRIMSFGDKLVLPLPLVLECTKVSMAELDIDILPIPTDEHPSGHL